MSETLTATCCCRKTAIEVAGPPAINGICHCANCKARTGSAFGWSCYFPAENVVGTHGTFRTYAISGDNPQERSFCEACGTTLFWTVSYFKGMVGVAGGCFEPGAVGEPDITINNEGRCAWLGLPDHWRSDV